ncbi:sterylglucosidase 1 [Aspergillus saccharolyticus JOP 1030-1]|uniref:Putative glycosyl hydrolase n=1 Tax=Aspergillus saccharolyticus JOP 1030-1 TaxID=1450539 RepID=A0A318Z4J1_9EURO|nr:putative glycosyl hydrolase [Aspergillus saccharolyticus JOP 1030-1]PYH41959.1 putative glycosyl hydrolase [Aspergillus saccharolyticus JOP 1030-1]
MGSLRLRIDGSTFKDANNREISLRGINVAGESKYPKNPDTPSYVSDSFFDADNVSFVGRPFSLEDAHTHFARLRKWGYNTIRYIFTWEAIEHEGPGKYDDEWITFTIEVLRIAKQYKFFVFLDPHQDVWSRLSGGSGAPAWTLYAAGLNPRAFKKTEAALVQNTYDNPAEFPKMIWSTNYTRLVCQTMFTLFWGGRDFAPKAIIDGMNIQDYLQGHFIAACKYFAQKVHEAGDIENDVVIGWESMNEPHRGLIGFQDISVIPPDQQLQLGTSPTAFQAMLTGSGRACEETTWAFGGFGPHQTGRELIDPEGESAWLPADYDDDKYGWKRDPSWKLGECLWAQHGVWDPSSDQVLRKDYFAKHPRTGEPLNYDVFTNTYFMEHYRAYRDALRSVWPEAILFCQPPVMEVPPDLKGTVDDDPNMVHAVHYYDGLTLLTKHWNRLYNVDVIGVLRGKYLTPAFAIKIGETAIRNCLRDQLKFLRDESLKYMGSHPMVFTEIGIPFDMDDKHAYKTGDYSSQVSAMDANHFALEGSTSNGFTLWLYTTTNNHEWGDNWNGEDLSIYSVDDFELPSGKYSDLETDSRVETDPHSPAYSESQGSIQHQSIGPDNLKSALSAPSITSEYSQNEDKLGFRAAEAFIRPSPIYTNGLVSEYMFDLRNCTFTLSLIGNEKTLNEETATEIYLPEFHFPGGHTVVSVSSGEWSIDSSEINSIKVQRLRWWHSAGNHDIKIQGVKRKPGETARSSSSDELSYLEQCQSSGCTVM